MRLPTFVIGVAILVILGFVPAQPAVAQTPEKSTAGSLPRVLIIGDSTYSGHTRDLVKALKGKVEVVYAFWHPHEIVDSATTLDLMERHLGRVDLNGQSVNASKWPHWDLIHFNCGLGDLIHRAPGLSSFRVMPQHVGGVRNTTEADYRKNLEALVETLKDKVPDAHLVWASTTPIRASATQVFEVGSEIEYNRIAAEVMNQNLVPINDMHFFVRNLIDMKKPAGFGADPFHFDKKPIHMPIVRILEQTFGLPAVEETEEEKLSRERSKIAAQSSSDEDGQ
jgi:hypothetical protein